MENQGIAQEQAVENPSVQFLSDEEVQAAQAPQETQSVIEQLQEEVAPQQESTEPAETIENTETTQTPDEEEVDIEGSVLSYLSERLGREITNFDDLTPQQQERALDERVEAIARFVEETGRDPQDWFRYQQLDASEMDDLTAVKLQMISDYQDLSSEELDILLGSKYKLDPDLHTEDEVKLSQLQLKMDAKAAREKITNLRDSYKTPMRTEAEVDSSSSPIDDKWISSMTTELNALEGVEFDLGDGNSFTFGLTNEYKSQLAEKNTRLDEFFDPYVREDGSWDYDKLNIHRSVIDNMEAIAKSIYKQGMADGQRNIVDRAANVSTNSPNQGGAQPESSPLADQLRNALGLGRGFGSNS
jgi:hypothetical protein